MAGRSKQKTVVRQTLTVHQIVAYNFRRAREENGWTQAQTSERLEYYLGYRLNQAGVSAIEKTFDSERRRNIDVGEIVAFAQCFKRPIGWFLLPPPSTGKHLLEPVDDRHHVYAADLAAVVLGSPAGWESFVGRITELLATDREAAHDALRLAFAGNKDSSWEKQIELRRRAVQQVELSRYASPGDDVITSMAALLVAESVYWRLSFDKAVTYLVAYLVEKSLSVDNLFVFLVIFSYFGVRERQQQRVLFWGIVGAVVMRAIFILAGSALLHRFHWMMYVFGAFLVITGVRLALKKDEETIDPESNLALRFARKYLRTTDQRDGDKFFIVKDGLRYATPLFLVLVVVEFTDVLFAVDSVPAVLAVSNDVFIVYTSNVFAILGLRALYFMLAGMMSRFHYLGLGLASILVFIGAKMLLAQIVKIPNLISLGVIAGLLTVAVVASMLRPHKPEPEPAKALSNGED